MNPMNPVLMAALLGACILDWKYRKIPNYLTVSLILCGIVFQSVSIGTEGLVQSLWGSLVGVLLLYIPFSVRGVGGGDVKLLAAIGAFTGPLLVLHVFLASAVFGGLFSLVEAARHGAVRKTFHGIVARVQHLIFLQKLAVEDGQHLSAKAIYIPYAISLTLGYIWVSMFGGVIPWNI